MARRTVLSAREIETILAVAGDAAAEETLAQPYGNEIEAGRDIEAFHRGMDKLRDMLAARRDRP